MTCCHPWTLKILICGAGFVGKYIAKALLHSDHVVAIIDKQNPDSIKDHPLLMDYANNPNLKVMWKSAGDVMDLAKTIKEYDAIIYTAAIADVPYALQNPMDTIQVNVNNTVSFMEMLRQSDFGGRLIMMSSESVYGHQPEELLPLKEDVVPKPINVYGAAKLAQESFALTYHRCYGIKTVVLRSATMFGPYSRPKQAMPIFIGQALRGEDFTLEGDGSQSRDMNYVLNMVDAIGLTLEKQGIEGEIFNIASGKEVTFKALVGAIQTLLGAFAEGSKVVNKPWRAGEKGLRVAIDITKAQERLGYVPQVPLLMGIKYTASWYAADVLRWSEKDLDALMSVFGFPKGQHIKRIGESIVRVVDEKPEPPKKVQQPMV